MNEAKPALFNLNIRIFNIIAGEYFFKFVRVLIETILLTYFDRVTGVYKKFILSSL